MLMLTSIPSVSPQQNHGLSLSLALWRALRPRQWAKNLLVFGAPFFAFEPAALLPAAATFVIFCAASSAVYLYNDIHDREADRNHEIKRHRPIASGAIPVGGALLATGLLTLLSLAGAIWLSGATALIVAAYFLIQLAYNLTLKSIAILDILALSSGFILRAVAGGVAAGIALSPWFIACIAFLAFFIGIEKRKAELFSVERTGRTTRHVLSQYSIGLLQRMETVVLACVLMTYALWTMQGAASHWMMLTLPFVAYGIFRYQSLTEQDSEAGERPEEILLRDRPLLVNTLLWAVTCFAILLFSGRDS